VFGISNFIYMIFYHFHHTFSLVTRYDAHTDTEIGHDTDTHLDAR